MSKSDTCVRCGKPGHTSSSCKRPIPPADHSSQPFDGTDRDMHRCADCAKGSIRHCRQFVPSITQPIRCSDFRARGGR